MPGAVGGLVMGTSESARAMGGTELAELARRMLGEADPAGGAGVMDDARPSLALRELIGDEAGEIVLRVGHGIRALLLEIDSDLIGRGIAGPHRTAIGEEVEGLPYLAFASGMVLYHPAGIDIALTQASS